MDEREAFLLKYVAFHEHSSGTARYWRMLHSEGGRLHPVRILALYEEDGGLFDDEDIWWRRAFPYNKEGFEVVVGEVDESIYLKIKSGEISLPDGWKIGDPIDVQEFIPSEHGRILGDAKRTMNLQTSDLCAIIGTLRKEMSWCLQGFSDLTGDGVGARVKRLSEIGEAVASCERESCKSLRVRAQKKPMFGERSFMDLLKDNSVSVDEIKQAIPKLWEYSHEVDEGSAERTLERAGMALSDKQTQADILQENLDVIWSAGTGRRGHR